VSGRAHSPGYDEADHEAWCLVGDIRGAIARGVFPEDPAAWVACVRSHLRRIDELRVELERKFEMVGEEDEE
jgi:hypothetical protein